MNKREVGERYEALAADYLRRQGYRIVEKNYRCRSGEIDLIARDREYLVFVEVKYRADSACGSPLEAVDLRKQRKLIRAAQFYLLAHGYGTEVNCRFDVVAVLGDEITLLRNAFGA